VFPALRDVARVERASTSTGIANTATGERYPNTGGLHIYLPIRDGADAERALRVMHDRLWLAGYGWVMVSAGARVRSQPRGSLRRGA
jgi:hypothetical protein